MPPALYPTDSMVKYCQNPSVSEMPIKIGKRRRLYFWWEAADLERELKRPRPWKGRIDWETTRWYLLVLALAGFCIFILLVL